ncbi:FGGY-family carbohydrate kinase [Carboxylicivirga sp. RSCT41]|uniref:FGGY-family carbohydrate kinase n=1 Tax=Carboxylicivirga agarovorans TaxID=3417570 RepID=UPI003D335F47
MEKQNVIAVFDIGKTNKKLLLFDEQMKVVEQREDKFPTTTDEDGFECDDIEIIEQWLMFSIKNLLKEGKYSVKALNFSTYGASLAFLNKEGERLTPIYNYLKEIDTSIQDKLFERYGGESEFCRQTASPALGLMLNSGIQLLWFKQKYPELAKEVEAVLHFPQYLSYLFTNKISSEPTSIGCHTFMWDFDNMQYHRWVKDEGLKLPEPVNNDTVYPAIVKGKEIKTGVGIHDSSASLVPYIDNSKDKFILVSTGTWCISMNPYNDEPLTSEQLMSDCLCFLTPQKQQVKSSRLFMGYFHEKLVEKLNVHFGADADYFKTIPYQPELIQLLKNKYQDAKCFFPLGIKGFDEGINEIDLSGFKDFDEAYTQMVIELTSLCIESIALIIPENDETEVLYVSGGFARNPIYIKLLADHFSSKKVFTSEIDNASALGAALVIADQLDGFDKTKIQLT